MVSVSIHALGCVGKMSCSNEKDMEEEETFVCTVAGSGSESSMIRGGECKRSMTRVGARISSASELLASMSSSSGGRGSDLEGAWMDGCW